MGLEILSLPLLLVIWQVLAMVFPSRLFPTPIGVAVELWDLTLHGNLLAGLLAYTVAFILVVLGFEYLVMRPIKRKVLRWRPARM